MDISQFWGSIPAPQWWKVDLQKEYQIDRVQVVPYWDGVRYHQYTVEVSTDGEKWKQVIDASKNAEVGTEKGYLHKFEPTKARYVKVNMLKNSDNPGRAPRGSEGVRGGEVVFDGGIRAYQGEHEY